MEKVCPREKVDEIIPYETSSDEAEMPDRWQQNYCQVEQVLSPSGEEASLEYSGADFLQARWDRVPEAGTMGNCDCHMSTLPDSLSEYVH